jgi:4-carboxymuconolactone decarboxylase
MTDSANPFEAMLKMGQDWARSLNPALASFSARDLEAMWPVLPREVIETFLGKTLNPEGLDAKTRMLLTLAGLTVQGAQADTQIRLTVRQARAAGATKQEIAETIAMMGLFGGLPAMTRALELAQGVLAENEGDAQ